MARTDYLFTGPDWFSVDRHQRQQMLDEISALDPDRLLNSSVEDLARYFEAKYRIEVPVLRTDGIVVDQREKQVDVSRDPLRVVTSRDQPYYITGTEVEVEIPFDGQPSAFNIQPNPFTLNPPRAEIQNARVVFRIAGAKLDPDGVKKEINRTVTSIESCLGHLRGNVTSLNEQLLSVARSAIEARRMKLLGDRNLVGSLGFRIKERENAPRTYTIPEIRRRIAPSMPFAAASPYKPEPALQVDDYEHILGIMESMAHVMELSPSAFYAMNEEALRSHFLVQLNGHYRGQATGETFNYEGKTDILVRSEGRNVFIAECKFWSGPKRFSETIDQLLSYSSWRDTKTAILLFNRKRDFTKVLVATPDAVRNHPNYKRDLPGSTETQFRYCFAHREDRNRELLLTVLAFNVPSPIVSESA